MTVFISTIYSSPGVPHPLALCSESPSCSRCFHDVAFTNHTAFPCLRTANKKLQGKAGRMDHIVKAANCGDNVHNASEMREPRTDEEHCRSKRVSRALGGQITSRSTKSGRVRRSKSSRLEQHIVVARPNVQPLALEAKKKYRKNLHIARGKETRGKESHWLSQQQRDQTRPTQKEQPV